jgi:predicted GIY-YIG superfamily endonuclease
MTGRKPRGSRRKKAVASTRLCELPEGTVYLLHYAEPLGFSQHYVGWTSSLDQRIEHHASGEGCYTTARFHTAGIGFVLARTWTGTLQLERKIKRGGPVNYCPLCKDQRREQREWRRGRAELRSVGLLPDEDDEDQEA